MKDREEQLIEICNKYRRNDRRYDCLFQEVEAKIVLCKPIFLNINMDASLTVLGPHIYTDWWKNHQSWIHAGFDNILFTPNGKIHRLITRLLVENLFHPFQPFILGQKNLAPKIAPIRYFILWRK